MLPKKRILRFLKEEEAVSFLESMFSMVTMAVVVLSGQEWGWFLSLDPAGLCSCVPV